MHDRRHRHALARFAEHRLERDLGLLCQLCHLGQARPLRPGLHLVQKPHLIQARVLRQHQHLQRRRSAQIEMLGVGLHDPQGIAAELHHLGRRPADRPVADLVQQCCQLILVAEPSVQLHQFADGAVDQRPDMRVGRVFALAPRDFPGGEGAREIAVMQVDDAEIGRYRDPPAGMRMGREKPGQAGKIIGVGPVFPPADRLQQCRVLGRVRRAGPDQRLRQVRAGEPRHDRPVGRERGRHRRAEGRLRRPNRQQCGQSQRQTEAGRNPALPPDGTPCMVHARMSHGGFLKRFKVLTGNWAISPAGRPASPHRRRAATAPA